METPNTPDSILRRSLAVTAVAESERRFAGVSRGPSERRFCDPRGPCPQQGVPAACQGMAHVAPDDGESPGPEDGQR